MNDGRLTTPVFNGLVRPPLLVGVDWRILAAAVVIALGGVWQWMLLPIGVGIYLLGLALAKLSPHFLSDLGRYMQWRRNAWGGYLPDESSGLSSEKGRKA